MKTDCNIIRDLLPLYADDACSDESRELVEEHLQECADCGSMLERLKNSEIEDGLKSEKSDVIEYGARKFKKRSATVGSTVSGIFMIPILVCLIINLTAGSPLGWFLIVLAALGVAASLILVPIMAPKDKLFWTFCAFTASLLLLLGAACVYTHGDWFWISASGVLFGLSLVFLPFLLRANPVKKLIGDSNRLMIILGVDAALFFNLLNAIDSRGKFTLNRVFFTVGVFAAIIAVVAAIIRNRKQADR